jgi:hypothetical protein
VRLFADGSALPQNAALPTRLGELGFVPADCRRVGSTLPKERSQLSQRCIQGSSTLRILTMTKGGEEDDESSEESEGAL